MDEPMSKTEALAWVDEQIEDYRRYAKARAMEGNYALARDHQERAQTWADAKLLIGRITFGNPSGDNRQLWQKLREKLRGAAAAAEMAAAECLKSQDPAGAIDSATTLLGAHEALGYMRMIELAEPKHKLGDNE